MPVRQAGRGDRARSARRCERGRPGHQDPRLRPQLVRRTPTTSRRPRPARTRRPTTPTGCSRSPAGRGSPGRRTTATPATRARRPRCTSASRTRSIWFTECSGSHGPTDPPAQVFRDTLEVARPQPRARRHPQLGEVRRQLEPRAATRRRPAQRRLRHLHRRGHRRAGRHRHPQRGVLHARPPGAASCGRARSGSPARRSAPPAGTAGRWLGVPQPRRLTALVVHNENDDPRTFAVARAASSFDYTLPGGALATFTWPASKALSGGDELVDPWTPR